MNPRLFAGVTALAFCSTVLAADWEMYQGGSQHFGYVPGRQDAAWLHERWTQAFGTPASLDAPVTGGGNVYVSEMGDWNNPSLRAVNESTGATVWKNTYTGVHSISPPSYAQGNVYFQAMKGTEGSPYFYSLNADTGGMNYQTKFPAQWEEYYSPTIVDGVSYVNGGEYGGMMAFRNSDGKRLWFNWGLPQCDQWTPTVVGDTAYAFLGNQSPGLYAVDLSTGVTQYRISDPGSSFGGYSMNQTCVPDGLGGMLATSNWRLIRFDLEQKSISYEVNAFISGQVTIANGVAYVVRRGDLAAYRVTDGKYLWGWDPGSDLVSTNIVVTDSHAFFGTALTTYAVNLTTHKSEFTYALSGKYALTGDTLYIAGTEGRLAAISTVPEPATLLLLGGGLTLLVRHRRKDSRLTVR